MPDFPTHEFVGADDDISCRAPVHGGASTCGYTRDSDVHQVDRTEVTVRRARPNPSDPTPKQQRQPMTWDQLPLPSKLVIAAVSVGAVPVFAAIVATLVAVILRSGGLIG